MLRRLGFLGMVALGGCTTGYLSDYVRPKASVIGPQLERYGLGGNACVEQQLSARLSTWQNRQLADLAERLSPGGQNPAALGPREFLYIAGLVEDARVRPLVAAAFDSCDVRSGVPAAPRANAAPEQPPAVPTPSAPAETAWLNLGSSRSGQGIAVDAATLTRGPTWRQAWFRLINPQGSGSDDIGYLLRIDCAARTITAHAGRKYGAGGELLEQKDYATPEGPMPIEPGTVIEVAFETMCYDPR